MKKRLEILYGPAHRLNYAIEDDMHIANLKIKLREVKNKLPHTG